MRPIIADDDYLKSILYGMAPAIVSGYKTCLRADPLPVYRSRRFSALFFSTLNFNIATGATHPLMPFTIHP